MQVIFHDIKRSQWVEDYIAERAQRLQRFASDITSCRVTLAQEHEVPAAARHHPSNLWITRIAVVFLWITGLAIGDRV